MIGERLKKARIDKGYTLEELGDIVGKSQSTLSRLENGITSTFEPDLLFKLADALNVNTSYLLDNHEDIDFNGKLINHLEKDQTAQLVVRDDEMEPELPEGAIVKIRSVAPDEKLQVGSFYYVEFNDKKCFRVVVDDAKNGIGFMPNDLSERRIAYDKEYVKIIGKVISMNVVFEDRIEYE